ncbi:hypothetical protein N7478_005620 [Penicillium angulare]|uniref:uncharacterized protein n=1 Tax=Penicillium angulare TaxID=116970 RepID=UPI002541818F|nr:uncharacterized protein N7478_005620 [Penicillium angulare]KAJ5280248.1 hypothetical protein N7478_005620 [Penicillium angulare]
MRHRQLAPAGAVEELHSSEERRQIVHQWKTSNSHSCLLALPVDASQTNLTFQERWFLDFFRRVTARSNATYFNRAFWGMLVHQASEIQPAVRYAAIGIGSLHWGAMTKTNRVAPNQIASFSLGQCNKAMEHLQQNLNAEIPRRPRMETVLISCGILLAFSFGQGDARAGGYHLRAGYELLQQWQRVGMDNSPVGTVILGSFYQLHLDWPSLVESGIAPKTYSYPVQLTAEYQSEALIETPEEACGALLILGWLALQMKPHRVTGSFESTPSAVLIRLRQWKGLILMGSDHSSQEKQDTIAILDVWCGVLLIKSLADDRLEEGEMRYDDYSSHFQRTIEQAKGLLARESLQNSWVRSGVVAPLFFCAFKCRDWTIRREALQLMSEWSGEQGVWSISKSYLVLGRLIRIESEGYESWERIPETARIDAVRVEFLPGETKVQFWYRRPVRLDQEDHPCHTWAWDYEIVSY